MEYYVSWTAVKSSLFCAVLRMKLCKKIEVTSSLPRGIVRSKSPIIPHNSAINYKIKAEYGLRDVAFAECFGGFAASTTTSEDDQLGSRSS